jgi:hypothetical protein
VGGSGSGFGSGNFVLTDLTGGDAIRLLMHGSTGNLAVGSNLTPGSRLSVVGNAAIGSAFASSVAPANGLIVEGNVGIGTSSPLNLLHLVSATNPGISYDNGADLFNITENANGQLQFEANYSIYNGSGVVMTLDDDNFNVGIGTVSPAVRLDVVEATNNAATVTRAGGSGLVSGIGWALKGDNTDGAGLIGFSSTGVGMFGVSQSNIGMNGLSLSAGNAGVFGRNDVVGGYGVQGFSAGSAIAGYFYNNSTLTAPQVLLFESQSNDYARLNFQNTSGSTYWAIAGLTNATNANERLNFYNSTSGDIMTLTGNGNVGIGHTSPDEELVVSNTAAPRIEVGYLGSAFNQVESGRLFFEEGTQATLDCGIEMHYDGTTNALTFYGDCSTPQAVMTIERGGDVGIGQINPSFDLEMGADLAAKPSSSAWTVISDSRLKTELGEFTDGLDVVKAIRPIEFRYTGALGLPTETTAIGTQAQELQEIAPYMVTTFVKDSDPSNVTDSDYVGGSGSGTEYLAVNYGALDFVLVNAIKELSAQIEQLQARIAELEQR